MRWRIPLVLILALFVAVSCDQQPIEPNDVSPVATTPVMNFTNGPELAGSVARSDDTGWIVVDFTQDETEKEGEPWMIFMGMGINDYHPSCEGPWTSPPWVQQTVRDVIELAMNQDMELTVFPFIEFFGNYMSAPAGSDPVWYASCETTRIASGTAHGVQNTTPAGEQYKVLGTIEYMGETYRLRWVLKFFGKDGFMRTMRVW